MSTKTPRVGQWVTVVGHKRDGAAKVEYVGGAGVRLDRLISGFRWWSAGELTAVGREQARALAKQAKAVKP